MNAIQSSCRTVVVLGVAWVRQLSARFCELRCLPMTKRRTMKGPASKTTPMAKQRLAVCGTRRRVRRLRQGEGARSERFEAKPIFRYSRTRRAALSARPSGGWARRGVPRRCRRRAHAQVLRAAAHCLRISVAHRNTIQGCLKRLSLGTGQRALTMKPIAKGPAPAAGHRSTSATQANGAAIQGV